MYLPAVLGGGGIFRNGVVQCNVQLGIFQPGSIHFNGFPMEVYTIALDEQPTEATFHFCRFNKSVGI